MVRINLPMMMLMILPAPSSGNAFFLRRQAFFFRNYIYFWTGCWALGAFLFQNGRYWWLATKSSIADLKGSSSWPWSPPLRHWSWQWEAAILHWKLEGMSRRDEERQSGPARYWARERELYTLRWWWRPRSTTSAGVNLWKGFSDIQVQPISSLDGTIGFFQYTV